MHFLYLLAGQVNSRKIPDHINVTILILNISHRHVTTDIKAAAGIITTLNLKDPEV